MTKAHFFLDTLDYRAENAPRIASPKSSSPARKCTPPETKGPDLRGTNPNGKFGTAIESLHYMVILPILGGAMNRIRVSACVLSLLLVWVVDAMAPFAKAQQILGGITGAVRDTTGAVLPGTVVTAVGDETQLTRVQKVNENGTYDFVNLPIGRYTLTFAHDAFESQRIPSITVQADRTATVNVALTVGHVSTT